MRTTKILQATLILLAIIGVIISLWDSFRFFYSFFDDVITSLTFLFPVILFYLIVSFNASGIKKLPPGKLARGLMRIFRIMLVLILLIPHVFNSDYNLDKSEITNVKWLIELFLVVFKIFGIEFLISILFTWVNSSIVQSSNNSSAI